MRQDQTRASAGRRRVAALAAAVTAVGGVLVGAVVAAPVAGAQTGSSIDAACPGGSVATGFRDVPSGGAHARAVSCLVRWGITRGTSATTFGHDDLIRRDQTATMLDRLLRETGDHPGARPSAGFPDVPADGVHTPAIDVLASLGVVTGSGGRFHPGASVTRAQMATMLVRLLEGVYGEQLPAGPVFPDVSGDHAGNIAKLVGAGITNGVRSDAFLPNVPVTRAQMASFVMRSANRLVLAGEATPPPAAPTSGGCGAAPPTTVEQSIPVGGQQRSFLLDLPTGYDRSTPYPIVFAFHGMGTSGSLFRSAGYGNLGSAMRSGAILVHPDAIGAARAWNASVDVPFFDAMLASLRSRLCVDTSRVFATGHSMGGFFSNELGCARGDVVRAIAPVSGGGPFSRSCQGSVAAWIAHGTNDSVVPFSSGTSSRDRWRAANGCGTSTRPAGSAVAYQGCAAGRPVYFAAYTGGHEFPRFAPQEIWAFFRSL